MKTIIKCCFLTALCLMAARAHAQLGPEISAENAVLKCDGKVEGGSSVANVVKVLRRLYPDVNIVVEPPAGDIDIFDVDLHSAGVGLDLEAFSVASGGKFVFEKRTSEDSAVNPSAAVAGPAPGVLYIIRSSAPPPDSHPPVRLAAFNLAPYCDYLARGTTNAAQGQAIKMQGIDKLQKIINHSLEAMHPGVGNMFGQNNSPQMDFYPDAELLVVIGSREELEAAHTIIDALPEMKGRLGPLPQEPVNVNPPLAPRAGHFPLPAIPR